MATRTVDDALRFELRPYQREAIDRTHAAELRGSRRQLGVAATGLGKTIIFCALAQQRGGRTLILAHRDELVSQAVAKVREVWPGVDVGVVKALDDHTAAHVVVASVQTLARTTRLDRLVGSQTPGVLSLAQHEQKFDLVVVDEAHHTAATTYRKILDALRAGESDGPLLLGVTATPDRGDGKGLDDLFDEIVWNFDILWGINQGYLCDLRAKRIVLDALDMGGVKVRRGDYDQGSAGRALEDADAPALIARGWKQFAADRRTLVFTPTVALADQCAQEFRKLGVRAAFVSGETPTQMRRELLADFGTGKVQVLANCAVLTEGYDQPRADCVIVARPTKSRALYTQMIGRGTRKHPDKRDCLVLDVVGASSEHSLVTVPSLFGLGEKHYAERLATENLTDVVDAFTRHQVKIGQLKAEDAELFHKIRSEGIAWVAVEPGPRAVRRYQRTQSTQVDGGRVQLPTVVLVQRQLDEHGWLAGIEYEDGTKRVLLGDVTLETAQGVGEDAVRKLAGPKNALVAADAPWRQRRPSAKAVAAAHKWKMPNPWRYSTGGELSDALDAHITRVKSRNKPPTDWTADA